MDSKRHPFDLSEVIALTRSLAPVVVRKETFSLLELLDQAQSQDIGVQGIISPVRPDGEQHAKEPRNQSACSGVLMGLEDQAVRSSKDTLRKNDTTEPRARRREHTEQVSASTNTRSASLVKFASLLVKLAHEFPESTETLLQTINPSLPRRKEKCPTPISNSIHVFVDHSNILIGFLESLRQYHHYQKPGIKRVMSFYRLAMLMERGRTCAKRVLAGSTKHSYSIREARRSGFELCILERVLRHRSHAVTHPITMKHRESHNSSATQLLKRGEQGVDEILHLKMLESLLDFAPSTLVLATGDGNISEFSTSFSAIVQRYLQRGWTVELVCFRNSMNRVWESFDHWGPYFRIVLLDDYSSELIEELPYQKLQCNS